MASRVKQSMLRAQAKIAARTAAAKKGWQTRRKAARAGKRDWRPAIVLRRDPLLASIGGEAPPESRPALVDLSAAIRASLGDIVRGDLVAFRAERVKAGDGASARAMTRIIADFDFVSRSIARDNRERSGKELNLPAASGKEARP